MTNYNRISSIDIFRGFTLLIMLFVNDLLIKSSTALPVYQQPGLDGTGLVNWILSGFLFIAGVVIPFSFSKRISSGEDLREMSRHVITRTISLLIIGVLMLNSGRVNTELTGFGSSLWSLLMYPAIFLIWNDYRDKENRFFTITTLRLAGISILVFLVFKFRSGQPENNGSLVTDWWGIPGLIGWGYFVSAFTYLFCRDSIFKTSIIASFFLLLNILAEWNILKVPYLISTIFGVIIDGKVPFIAISGLIAGLIIRKFSVAEFRKVIPLVFGAGILCLGSGLILQYWSLFPEIIGKPGWILVYCGGCMTIFILIYWIADVKKITAWAAFIRPAAEHSLTAYLATYFIYYLILSSGVPVLIYKLSSVPFFIVAGSLFWALLMVLFTAILARLNIRLKL